MPTQKSNGNTQSGGERFFKQQAIKKLSQEHDWPISVLCQIAGITRDAYYSGFIESQVIIKLNNQSYLKQF